MDRAALVEIICDTTERTRMRNASGLGRNVTGPTVAMSFSSVSSRLDRWRWALRNVAVNELSGVTRGLPTDKGQGSLVRARLPWNIGRLSPRSTRARRCLRRRGEAL